MKKQFAITAALLFGFYAWAGQEAALLDTWMKGLQGHYSMNGSTGCNSFKIVRQASLLDFFYYADFGSARIPQEALLFNTGARTQITINSISDNQLSAEVVVPSSGLWGVPGQRISFDIQKNGEGKLKSLAVSTQQGLSFNSVSCD